MAINYTDTTSFEWTDTTAFDWTSETSSSPSPLSVLSGVPVVQAVTASMIGPVDVLSGTPVIESLAVVTENAPRYTVKSLIFDFADQWSGNSLDKMGVRRIDFYLDGVKYNLKEGISDDFISLGSSADSGGYDAYRAFDMYGVYTGISQYNSWRTYDGASYIINQRIYIVFNSEIIFDAIVVNNYHNSGADTDCGVKNTKIYSSSEAVLNYNYNEDIEDYTLLFDGVISQHSALDEADPETLLLIAPSQNVLAGIPVVQTVTASPIQYPEDVVTSAAVVPVVTGYVLTEIDDIVTGTPVISALTGYSTFGVDSITTGVPVIGMPRQLFQASMIFSLPETSIEFVLGNDLSFSLPETVCKIESYSEIISHLIGTINKTSLLFEANSEQGAYVSFDLPITIMTSNTGAVIDFQCPLSTMTSITINEAVVFFDLTLPKTQSIFTAINQAVTEVSFNVPVTQMTVNNIIQILGDISAYIGTPTCLINAINTAPSNMIITTPITEAIFSSYSSNEGQIDFSIPISLLFSSVSTHTDNVLRHVRGAVR